MPVKKLKEGSVLLLFDTGSIITFIKARALKEETTFIKDEIMLTDVTRHRLKIIGYFNVTIKIGSKHLRHRIYMYIIRNSFPIDYEGILEADFFQRHKMACNYFKLKLTIREERLPLIPLESYLLPARSEIIINATTNTSKTDIVKTQEIKPGVYEV